MEQMINWVEPELKWVEFGANEYVAVCTYAISASECVGNPAAGENATIFMKDEEHDGIAVQELNNVWSHAGCSGGDYITKETDIVGGWYFSNSVFGVLMNSFYNYDEKAKFIDGDGHWLLNELSGFSDAEYGYTYQTKTGVVGPITATNLSGNVNMS